MIDSTLLFLIIIIWIVALLFSLKKKKSKKIFLINIIIAALYSTTLFSISYILDNRDALLYITLTFLLLGIHSLFTLVYVLLLAFSKIKYRSKT